MLPCPVNPRQFADTIEGPDGQLTKRRRRRKEQSPDEGLGQITEEANMMDIKRKRECPMPKPGGLVGQIMGFKEGEKEKPSEIVVKDLQGRRVGVGKQSEEDAP